MDSKQYEDMIARVRLKVGFASAAVTKELKRRLIA